MKPDDLLDRLLSVVEQAEVPYMVTGSLASSHHGIPRATQDLDIVLELSSEEEAERLLLLLPEDEYYVSRAAVAEAVRRRTMFNVVDYRTGMKADLIVRKDRSFSQVEFSRRRPAEVMGRRAIVASPEDVILSKLEWYRISPSDRQLRDASGIVDVQGGRLDLDYLDQWSEALGVADLWRELRPT